MNWNMIQGVFNVIESQHNIRCFFKHKCCQGCATASIAGILEKHPDVNGYCYFHEQDYDSAQEGGELYLGYGGHGDTSSKEVGEKIASAFRTAFDLEWDGSAATRIVVKGEPSDDYVDEYEDDIEDED